MTDTIDPARRSKNMSRIRGRDTKPEMAVRRLLYRMGYRYRLQSYCQIWCTEGWSCGGSAVLYDLDTVRELDPLDHFAELPEAA